MAGWSDSDPRAVAWKDAHGEALGEAEALAFHLRARAALGHALERLDAAGVPALVVKGAVLAHTLYASPLDRPIRDVDLRVLPRDVARASDVLTAAPGARLLVSSRVYGTRTLSFERVELDLESRIGPPFVCALGVEAMLARAERTRAGLGFWHRRPEVHDHAVLLAVNLFKDRFADASAWRLRDLELIAALPGFEVEALARRATEARCRTLVHVVARYLARRTGSGLWRDVADGVPPAHPRQAEAILDTVLRSPGAASLVWRARVRACADTWLRSAGALAATALREVERASGR